jgi:hypothetical protein
LAGPSLTKGYSMTKICTKCHEVKELSEFYFRKDMNCYRSICKKCNNIASILYINSHPRKKQPYKYIYNKPTIKHKLRCRIYNTIKRNHKSLHTTELIGCSFDFIKQHLQQTAINNGYKDFDINNYSGKEYHIDHIVPIDAFNLDCIYHQKLCFNWTNMQILDSTKNLIKHNSIGEI